MTEPIDTLTLRQWLTSERPFVLLDVLPRDVHEEQRIPRSACACVYETTFLDQVAALVPDRATELVVYASGPGSRATAVAAKRLAEAGYSRVREFGAGREAWQDAGFPFEGSRAGERWQSAPPRPLPDGSHAVDTAESVVEWTGRNAANRHYGTLRLSSGVVDVRDGALLGGSFAIDMRSIRVGDLEGDTAALLRRHLEHDDFFAVARHPEARLVVRSAVPIEGATPGTPNYRVQAAATVRGVERPVEFPVSASPHGDGGIAVQAHFDLDRTVYGALYGSGRHYERLGMHLVDDAVSLQVRILARRE